jgi:hypothetical protein
MTKYICDYCGKAIEEEYSLEHFCKCAYKNYKSKEESK